MLGLSSRWAAGLPLSSSSEATGHIIHLRRQLLRLIHLHRKVQELSGAGEGELQAGRQAGRQRDCRSRASFGDPANKSWGDELRVSFCFQVYRYVLSESYSSAQKRKRCVLSLAKERMKMGGKKKKRRVGDVPELLLFIKNLSADDEEPTWF